MQRLVLTIFLCLISMVCVADGSSPSSNTSSNQTANTFQTAVIPLQNRAPSDLIPALQPFLDNGGQIEAFENQLIVKTSANNLSTIQDMVKQLDLPVKKLMISVSNGSDQPADANNAGSSLSISTQRDEDTQVNHIRVDNGQVAFINTGVTVPLVRDQFAGIDVYNRNSNWNLNGPVAGQGQTIAQGISGAYGKSVDYKNLSNGLLVKPTLVGNEVRVELLSKNDQPINNQNTSSNPAYTTLKTETTLMIPLGKWVYFGGNRDPNELSTSTSTTIKTQTHEDSQKNLWIKVDEITE